MYIPNVNGSSTYVTRNKFHPETLSYKVTLNARDTDTIG